jgi:hypothetical protein
MRHLYATALALAVVLALTGCPPTPAPSGTKVAVKNEASDAAVYVAFGADSSVGPSDWSFCSATSDLTCSFPLSGGANQPLPTGGAYLNATLTFDAPVGCGTTKAEINVNNPKWYDTFDVSLVDGYSNKVKIVATALDGTSTTLGPPNGDTGNASVFGVYPYGCDICVARQNPPCGIPVGTDGCKAGTQDDPDVACQFQGAAKGGGGSVEIVFLGS